MSDKASTAFRKLAGRTPNAVFVTPIGRGLWTTPDHADVGATEDDPYGDARPNI